MLRSLSTVLLTGFVLAMAAFAPAQAEKKASFPERAFDAGDVQHGGVIEHVFQVKNDGDEPLTIIEVHPTCGCTILDYTKTPIPPGGVGTIQFKIETKTLASGKASKTITVMTDAPEAERTVLQMKLNIVTPLEFLPRAQVYIYTLQGEGRTEKILVRPHLDGLKVLGVSSSNPNLKVSLEPSKATASATGEVRAALIERPGDYWVTIELAPGAPVGTFKSEISVSTSDPAATAGSVLRIVATVKEPAGAARPGKPS